MASEKLDNLKVIITVKLRMFQIDTLFLYASLDMK